MAKKPVAESESRKKRETVTPGLRWLVRARNDIQSLLLDLLDCWDDDDFDSDIRDYALGAAFSLWRSVFLIAEDETDRSLKDPNIDEHAKSFLQRLVRTNAITFNDEWNARFWTGGFYLNNSVLRVSEMIEGSPESYQGGQLRTAWYHAYRDLKGIIDGHKAEHKKKQ